MGPRLVMSALLRFGRLALVSYAVAIGTWTILAPSPLGPRDALVARAASASRGSSSSADRAADVSVSVDGLTASARTAGTVEDALRSLGLASDAGDRLSVPADASVLAGHRITVDRGVPVTLLDGGQAVAARSPRGTVADLLAAADVTLGPLDRIDRELGMRLRPGDVIRITRIADRQETLQESAPFEVRYIQDPNLERLRQVVVTPGVPGQLVNRYAVHVVDGREVERVLLASLEVTAPVGEVRRIGTRAPQAPTEIESIIREAAARQGADAEQLLRVAWCESRFNPGAYNASGASGLFQFMPRTWAANSVRAGYAGASVFDPVASANVAAWMFAHGSANLWTCR
jgi:uncharacterized protein YabE (DUF348 family)